MDGHEAFAKAAQKPQKPEGTGAIVGGSALIGQGAATAPVMRVGRKNPTSVIAASPKKQPRRYQGELTRAMREGKVDRNSTLRVLKTPSGRFINAGGTHRHLARQAMGLPSKMEVKELGYEPKFSLADKMVNTHKINQLKRGSRDAVAGNAGRVSTKARGVNEFLAAAADTNDDARWKSIGHHVATEARAVSLNRKLRMGNAALTGAMGAGLLGAGLVARHQTKPKQKVVKAMNDGHDAFEISKRNRDTSFGRDVTGALFPGIHGAIAGKPGHKVKAAAYELGGEVLAPTIGSGVGTHIASQKGHYVKLKARGRKISKANASVVVDDPKKAGKKVQVAYPPEVKAYIENKKADLAKSATGHDVFLEDVSKALPTLGGYAGAARGVGQIVRGLGRDAAKGFRGDLGTKAGVPGGTKAFNLGMGASRKANKVGRLVRQNPKVAQGVAHARGAGMVARGLAQPREVKVGAIAGGAGLGAGYMAGRRH